MTERLTPLEASLLALDTAHTPAHIGTVDVFASALDGLDYERLLMLLRSRITFVPRYRMRVRSIPARLAGPVWVEDADFDLSYHVRRSALPGPGTPAQLREFVGRVCARRLDRSRPLWEMYLVEGLENDRLALVTKSHLALVDGVDTVEIGQVLLDADPQQDVPPADAWQPLPEPSALELLAEAMWNGAQNPVLALENVRGAVVSALGVAVAVGEVVGGLTGTLGALAGEALRGGRPAPDSPLAGPVSEQRRFATAAVPLADLKRVRDRHGHTINDGVLAMIAGALRSWLQTRGRPLAASTSLQVLAPMSVTDTDGEPTSLGSSVTPHLMALPIGEPNAVMRLHQIAYGTQAHKDTGRAVAARSITDLAGFAPTTLHALGVRVAGEMVRRQHDLVVTNVPGPQAPVYAAGSRLLESYPVVPLSNGHLLAIGVTSYDGQVHVGLTGDRDAVSDLDVLAGCLTEALAELVEASRSVRTRRPSRRRGGSPS